MPLFRDWIGYQVPDSVAQIVATCRDASGKVPLDALRSLIRENGKSPEDFVLDPRGVPSLITPRFIDADGEQYVVFLMKGPASFRADLPSSTVLLLSIRGRVLDRVDLLCSSFDLELAEQFLDGSASDGAWITINPAETRADRYTSYRLYQYRREVREGFVLWAGDSEFDDLCRLGIRADRLEVLIPARR